MSKITTGARMAAMAAAFAASSFAIGADMPAGASGKAISATDTVHCYGLTSCKGQADCKTAENACKGQNACKGHGFKAMKAAECLSAKGTISDISNPRRPGCAQSGAPANQTPMQATMTQSDRRSPNNLCAPFLGYGLGLRPTHYADFLAAPQAVDWLEIISENYMIQGGKPLAMLDAIRQDYPVVMHGVSMSIGSVQPLDGDYLNRLKSFAARIEPKWISDHLCWTGVHGVNLYDLYPLPYTEEALGHVVGRIRQVQDILGRRLVIENVSSYINYADSAMSEWEFITAIAEQADCLLLLDVNNIYVSSINHGFDPQTFIDHVPAGRVQQIHLAGHSDIGDFIIDTHDAPIIDPVFDLYGYACRRLGQVSTMIERDDKIPPLTELIAELKRVRDIAAGQFAIHQRSKEIRCAA